MASIRILISAVVAAFTLLGNVNAGLFDDEEARRAILELRQINLDQKQQIDDLRRDIGQKISEETHRSTEEGVQFRRAFIDLQNQLESLRAELAQLRGRNEQITRDLAEMQRWQKDFTQTVDERLRTFEPARISLDGREFLAEPAERRDYDAAVAVFRKGNFANAQLVLADFLNRYPQSGYRPSALFWLGNAQYATKDYKESMSNFRLLVAQAPDHVRVPEARLAIANCQLEMKDGKAARKTLEELVATYPGTEAAAAAKDRLARFK